MAGAFAIIMKRRYNQIVAKQEEREKRQRRKRLKRPPTSTENTLVWHWELDGMYTTVMYDKQRREVWCNGLVLQTESILPEVTGEQCSIGFFIDTRPECEHCQSTHCSTSCSQHTSVHSQDPDIDNKPQQDSREPSLHGNNLCDCVQCNNKLHKALIKLIRVEVDKTAYELYVDGCMIQEHTEHFEDFSNPKSDSLKKND